ncbi:MAG: hypothetical protein P8164_05020 [Gammaproteobacteria bacterium]
MARVADLRLHRIEVRSIFVRSVYSLASAPILAMSFGGVAQGQQTNIHVSMPPITDPDFRHEWQISTSYISMNGQAINANGIDINNIFMSRPIRNDKATNFTLGTALLYGDMDIDSSRKGDLSSLIINGSSNKEYIVSRKPRSSLTLFVGIPFSFGDSIIENIEDVTLYNLLAGVQAGARLSLRMGNVKTSPWLMVNLMGGYRERYGGGVYYENLNSGGVPIFAVVSSGLEILYLPLDLTLDGIYQKTLESGNNEPIESVIIQLGFGLF